MKQLENKVSNVLMIGGGKWQLPLITYLKQKGHYIFVVDPFLDSPGVVIADKHIQCDVRNVNKIIELTKNIIFDFIVSDQSDIAVNTVSKLNYYFKLKGNSFNATNRFVNKYEMRKLAESIGLPIPAFKKISNVKQLFSFIKENGLPIILKPSDSQSSRGLYKIDDGNLNKIDSLVRKSLKYSNCGYLIAENFVEGIEVTVEGFASNYKHRTLAISQKEHFRTGIASSLKYPAEIPNDLYTELELLTDKFVENSGLNYGITHAEYIIDIVKKNIALIEIACRGGGTLISSDIVKWVSGINVYDLLYDNLRGITVDTKKLDVLKRPAILKFFEFKEGRVKRIIGLEKIKQIKGVFTVTLEFKENDYLSQATDDRSRQGFYIAFADSNEELNAINEKIKNVIKIEYE